MATFYNSLFRVLIYVLAQLCVSEAQVIILEPKELAQKFPESKILGSTAAFGTPYYGQRVTGELFYFDTTGCKDADYNLIVDETHEGLPPIVMIRRGSCHFVTKVQTAEKKGAKAVVVMDSEGAMTSSEDVLRVIMADDGWGDGVKIPSMLIGEVEGLKVVDALGKGKQQVIVELAWDIPKDNSVQMDIWLSPAITQSINFVKEYAPYARQLKHKLDFRPHYWIMSLPGNFKDMCTDETGRFCGLDPDWGGVTTGKQVVEESVRQLCLWEVTQTLDESDPHSGYYSEAWWNYVEVAGDRCPHNGANPDQSLGETCSHKLMTDLGVSISKIKRCYEQNFVALLTHELVNKAWSPLALMVNNWRYSGPLDPEIVTRAVCTGFKTENEECRKIFRPSKLELMQEGIYVEEIHEDGLPLWVVIFLGVLGGLIGVGIAAVVFWKFVLPKIRSSMRYAIMDEVRKGVALHERDNVSFTCAAAQPAVVPPLTNV